MSVAFLLADTTSRFATREQVEDYLHQEKFHILLKDDLVQFLRDNQLNLDEDWKYVSDLRRIELPTAEPRTLKDALSWQSVWPLGYFVDEDEKERQRSWTASEMKTVREYIQLAQAQAQLAKTTGNVSSI